LAKIVLEIRVVGGNLAQLRPLSFFEGLASHPKATGPAALDLADPGGGGGPPPIGGGPPPIGGGGGGPASPGGGGDGHSVSKSEVVELKESVGWYSRDFPQSKRDISEEFEGAGIIGCDAW